MTTAAPPSLRLPFGLVPGERLQFAQVHRAGRRRDLDRLVPLVEADRPCFGSALGDLQRVGLAVGGDVERPAEGGVLDRDRPLAVDRADRALFQRAMADEDGVEQLAHVRQRGKRGKFRRTGGDLQPLARQQLRRRRAAELAVEGVGAADVGGFAVDNDLEGRTVLGDLSGRPLARREAQVQRHRRAAAVDRAGDVYRRCAVSGALGFGDDLLGAL